MPIRPPRTVLVLGAALSLSTAAAAEVHQLRIYEIFEGNKQAFHDRFRDHALRIMKRHGFDVISTWETSHEGRTEFVYLLRWRDEGEMKARWTAFMADAEWTEIKRVTGARHGDLVGGIEERMLRLTPYSPGPPGGRTDRR